MLLRLAQGNDMSIRRTHSVMRQFSMPTSRAFLPRALCLNGTNAGPKITPKTVLSGDPTFTEVQKAFKGLSRGTAPGSNGLRPELLKLGGDVLAKRLVSDFDALWPTEEEIVLAYPLPPKADILQTRQDADVVTLFKMKGDPTDPSNYRSIFFLDVAGKVLASK